MFNGIYRNKKVLVTGHTGFKGSWLCEWLLSLGADVYGISKDIPTQPSLFEVLRLSERMQHTIMDIREKDLLVKKIQEIAPDFLFHLAAQPIVSLSYADPVSTIETNVMGTAHLLEALRLSEFPCTAVIITSDKCYENVEWVWGYKETDALGGKDIYSGSKGAAEVLFHAYYHSFLKHKPNLKIATARAGNVIGGGDWAADRIVPDCVRSWSKGVPVEIRSPEATRPWQHVLEPLSGYLLLGEGLCRLPDISGQSFNFGPKPEQNSTVLKLLRDIGRIWNLTSDEDACRVTGSVPFHEAGLLKLNCDKALFYLKWQPTLEYDELIDMTGSWYYSFYHEGNDMPALTRKQISAYEEIATSRHRVWCSHD